MVFLEAQPLGALVLDSLIRTIDSLVLCMVAILLAILKKDKTISPDLATAGQILKTPQPFQ